MIRGNTLVVPIKNSLLYIEPIYITSSSAESSIPELKKVILAYDDKVVMEDNLGDCLSAVFNIPSDVAELQNSPNGVNYNVSDDALSAIIARLVENYDALSVASKDGNWVAFGEKMAALSKNIGELESYSGNTSASDTNQTDNTSEQYNSENVTL